MFLELMMIGKEFGEFWKEDSRWGDACSELSEGILSRETWQFVGHAVIDRLASEHNYWSKQLYDSRQAGKCDKKEEGILLFIDMLNREMEALVASADLET
jgi:hypothetical protein